MIYATPPPLTNHGQNTRSYCRPNNVHHPQVQPSNQAKSLTESMSNLYLRSAPPGKRQFSVFLTVVDSSQYLGINILGHRHSISISQLFCISEICNLCGDAIIDSSASSLKSIKK